MPETHQIPRPSQLWKQLSSERKLQAAEAFWSDENAALEQAEAIAAIAQRIKFRPKSVVALPRGKKAHHLAALGAVSELVAARLLVAYHLGQQRPMMASFLDALGIGHEDGLISEEDIEAPAPERLQDAARTIAQSYPADEVALYLSTLVWQDPDTWGALADVPETRAVAQRLALSFLLLIGVSLMAEAFEQHIPKGYIYFAMAFSVFVEMINLRVRKKAQPVHLHQTYTE